MTKSLTELRKKINSEVQAAARAKAIDIIAEMHILKSNSSLPLKNSLFKKS